MTLKKLAKTLRNLTIDAGMKLKNIPLANKHSEPSLIGRADEKRCQAILDMLVNARDMSFDALEARKALKKMRRAA